MNKDEADRCREMGMQALRAKDYDKAIRLFQKAVKLHPGGENQSFLDLALEKKEQHSSAAASEEKEQEETKLPKYTQHQEELCLKLLAKENYYEILGVEKEASLDDIKKAYKRLALKLHPDKNHHPKATDAFKKVNRAFSCLSDETKKRVYDQTGTEETPMGGGGPQNFDSMFAEHIFQQFFGESFFMPRGGFHHMNMNFHHQHHNHEQQDHQPNQQQQNRNAIPILQLMPVILLIFISIVSSYNTQVDPFSFHPTSTYSYEKYTRNNNIRYFVEPSYARELRNNLSELQKIESLVENNYVTNLKRECSASKEKKKILLNKANYYSGKQSKQYRDMAEGIDLWTCDKLKDFVRV